ncbi:hypothetical protein E2C01_018663 [Portunus trituberculatus]|uniref:Uncharacterized protein n=1 Tax=Portunus trituberculatus TaxID=210409 RepID=A0A5B7DW91_PORTR|nr:hypothetical protein [Portunus trituberculatus]
MTYSLKEDISVNLQKPLKPLGRNETGTPLVTMSRARTGRAYLKKGRLEKGGEESETSGGGGGGGKEKEKEEKQEEEEEEEPSGQLVTREQAANVSPRPR